MYPKDTEKWKQFTTASLLRSKRLRLFCIPKILKNESNSQLTTSLASFSVGCFVSQRYWKMKAIHNDFPKDEKSAEVVLYPKDTEKWKQFTTLFYIFVLYDMLFCIPKILKNESNSQLIPVLFTQENVVLYPKDTEKWKQFTTLRYRDIVLYWLFCIPKILKNESNSQQYPETKQNQHCCFVSQRYWKMKAIHNEASVFAFKQVVVLYPKDTEKWKQFTTQ